MRAGVVGESILVIGPWPTSWNKGRTKVSRIFFLEGRGSTVKGTDKYQRNCEVDVMTLTNKESTFGEEFETGSSQAVWAFARQRRLKFNYPEDEDLLVAHIEDKYPNYTLSLKEGVVMVEMPDHVDGTFRWKRGTRNAAELSKTQKHDTEAGIEEHYEDEIVAVRKVVGGSSVGFRARCHQAAIDAKAEAFCDDGDEDLDADAGSNAGTSRSRSSTQLDAGSVSGRVGKTSDQMSFASAQAPMSARSVAAAHGDGDGEEATGVPATKKRRTSQEKVVFDAEEHLSLCNNVWNFRQHYERKGGRRPVATISARWRKCARVAGALIQNTKALDVAAKLDDAAELLEIRHDVFEKIRSNFGEYALETQTAQEKTIFSQAEPDLLAHIITIGAWQVVDNIKEPNAVEALVSVLTYKSVVKDCLSLRLIPQGSLSLVEPVQRTLAWGVFEKVWKTGNVTLVASIIASLEKHMPTCPPLHTIDVKTNALLSTGWFAQPSVDLHCLCVLGRFLHLKQSDTKVSPADRSAGLAIIRHKDLISSRVTVLFKPLVGCPHAHLRPIWLELVQSFDQYETQAHIPVEKISRIEGFSVAMEDAWGDGLERVQMSHTAVCEVLEKAQEHGVDLCWFGRAYDGSTDADCIPIEGGADPVEVAGRFSEALTAAVECVLGFTKSHRDVFDMVFASAEFVPTKIFDSEDDLDEDSPADSIIEHPFDALKWLHEALNILECYKTSDDQLVQAALRVMKAMLKIYNTIRIYDTDKNTVEVIRSFVSIWSDVVFAPAYQTKKAATDQMDCLHTLATTAQLRANVDAKIMALFYHLLATEDSLNSAPMVEWGQQKYALPQSLAGVIDFLPVVERGERGAKSIREGSYSGGLLELTTLAHDLRAGLIAFPKFSDNRAPTNVAYDEIVVEWEICNKRFLKKFESLTFLDKLQAQHGKLLDAATSWDFTTTPWIHDDETSETKTLGKQVHHVISQWQTLRNTLMGMKGKLGFASPDAQAAVDIVMNEITAMDLNIAMTTKLIATMVLVSVLVKSGEWTDERNLKLVAAHTFVLKTLRVPESELAATLVDKLNEKMKETTVAASAKVSVAASPVPINDEQLVPVPVIAKLKKLKKSCE
jgi:hypothetical protein